MVKGVTDFRKMELYSPKKIRPILSSLEIINIGINGYLPGKLYLWTGHTGHGKTSFLAQEIVAALIDLSETGEKVFWYCGEQSRTECLTMLAKVLLGPEVVKTYIHRTGHEESYIETENLQKVVNWLQGRLFLRCLNDYQGQYLPLLDIMREAKDAGATYFVLDNLMTITAQEMIQGKDEWEKQERFILDLKEFTKEEGKEVVMHLVAHPRKPQILNGRPLPIVDISQVLGTSKVGNLVDIGYSVNRLSEEEKVAYRKKLDESDSDISYVPDVILYRLKLRGIQCSKQYFPVMFDSKSCRFYTNDFELYKDLGWENVEEEVDDFGIDSFSNISIDELFSDEAVDF